jgi:DNA-binding YbaB/EbfC family protein
MNLMDMAKQVKNLQKARAALTAQLVTGTGGRGAVTVEMNGAMQVKSVKIDPQMPEKDRAHLEKWVAEAFNDALGKVQKVMASQLSQLGNLGGMNPFA